MAKSKSKRQKLGSLVAEISKLRKEIKGLVKQQGKLSAAVAKLAPAKSPPAAAGGSKPSSSRKKAASKKAAPKTETKARETKSAKAKGPVLVKTETPAAPPAKAAS